MRTHEGGLWLPVLVSVERELDLIGFAAQVVAFNLDVELTIRSRILDDHQHGPSLEGLKLLSLRVELGAQE